MGLYLHDDRMKRKDYKMLQSLE